MSAETHTLDFDDGLQAIYTNDAEGNSTVTFKEFPESTVEIKISWNAYREIEEFLNRIHAAVIV